MANDVVDSNEFIIRRIPPTSEDFETIVTRPDGTVRPSSATLGLASGELGLSCSQLSVTSPQELLAQEPATQSGGWMIAKWQVRDIPEGLEVVVTPSNPPELDPGHCEIRPKPGIEYKPKLRTKLAKAGTILNLPSS